MHFSAPGKLCLFFKYLDNSLTEPLGSLDMKVPLTMIRPYQHDDTDAVVDVWRAASLRAHPFVEGPFLDQEADNMRNVYLAIAETFVTEVNGEVVGFIAMIDNEIGGLFLHPAHHGRGRGRSMVDHVRAKRQILTVEVFKKNTIGRRFYESYGFRQVGSSLHPPTGEQVLKLELPNAAANKRDGL